MSNFTLPPGLKPVITICMESDSATNGATPILYGHSSELEPIMISPPFIAIAANALYAFMLNSMPESYQNEFLEYCKDVNLEMWNKEDIGEKLLYFSSFGNNLDEIREKIKDLDLEYNDEDDDEEGWRDE